MKNAVDDTIRVYDSIAEEWHAMYGRLSFMRDFADIFIENLKGKKVLDLGCGPGRDAKYLSEKGFSVVGVDLCERFLEMARLNAPKAEFRKMDLRNISFPESSFDGVWAAASILHIPKKEAISAIKEMAKILKQGGVIYISLLKGRGEKYTELEFGNGRFFAYYEKEEIERLLAENGFEIIETYPSPGEVNVVMEWLNIFAVKK
mgnify:CR=1 FL=1